MACEENELLEVLRNKVMNMSVVVDTQNDLILKYEKALSLAVDDTVLASDCCGCCPFFYDCEKEDVSVNECKEKFMHRWKSMAGLILGVIDAEQMCIGSQVRSETKRQSSR